MISSCIDITSTVKYPYYDLSSNSLRKGHTLSSRKFITSPDNRRIIGHSDIIARNLATATPLVDYYLERLDDTAVTDPVIQSSDIHSSDILQVLKLAQVEKTIIPHVAGTARLTTFQPSNIKNKSLWINHIQDEMIDSLYPGPTLEILDEHNSGANLMCSPHIREPKTATVNDRRTLQLRTFGIIDAGSGSEPEPNEKLEECDERSSHICSLPLPYPSLSPLTHECPLSTLVPSFFGTVFQFPSIASPLGTKTPTRGVHFVPWRNS